MDAIRYLLSTHRPVPTKDVFDDDAQDRHPGLSKDGRRSRWEPVEEPMSDARYDRGAFLR